MSAFTRQAAGTSSQAARLGNLLFTSGQLPIAPISGDIESPYDAEQQAHEVFNNLESLLEVNGLTMQNVVKCTLYLVDMDDFDTVLAVYEQHFKGHQPARSTIQAAKLPEAARVMVEDVVAEIPAL